MLGRDLFKVGDQIGRGEQRILPVCHRSGARVGLTAQEGQAIFYSAPEACEDTEPLAGVTERGVSLDMQFNQGVGDLDLVSSRITDLFQRLAHRDAVAVSPVKRPFKFRCPGKDTAAQKARLETCAFFIGPVDDLKVAGGNSALSLEALGHRENGFTARDDAKRAVEAPAVRLTVNVRSDHDHRSVGASQRHLAELVANCVDGLRETVVGKPSAQPVACHAVFSGKRKAGHRSVRTTAEGGHRLHQRLKTLGIDRGRRGENVRHV
ncbi:hypothetical protein D3C72_1050740 [compost metagenome]